ncbi:MAG: HD-GYP domain-containing protein [Synergistaceae bacterium]|jgi:HD-GYP domain-containing protein (c-di-GMP phosphodiesterase class II)|nr:HD-GYP domain-containing protein [Synergistaceae bacterium]
MKKAPSYKMRISIDKLLDYPNAILTRDILSQTGSTVLLPSRVPITKLVEGLEKPQRIIDSLDRLGIRTVDVEIPQNLDDEDILLRLKEFDPSIVVIDNEVTKHAQSVIKDVFDQASISERFSVPKDAINELSQNLSEEINRVSQIALSMITNDIDSYTQCHALNVSMLSGYIAKKLVEAKKAPKSLVNKTIIAGLFFDIGKTATPKEILNKDGELEPEELDIIRNHINESVSICKNSGITDKDILDGIASHHERYDGSGYPRGLVGSQIPLVGRILAVADTFDAMTSPRIYKSAVSSKLSFNFIMSANETQFDPDICKIFISGMGVYPPGSMVELSNGKIAAVVAISNGNLLQPKVAVNENGTQKILDLVQEKLFIKKSLDMAPRDEVDLLLSMQ